MKIKTFLIILTILWGTNLSSAQTLETTARESRYIEVIGTSETEVIPDEIHYLIEIREYWEEEFDGKSKPENYRTKVGIVPIEANLRQTLEWAKIPEESIRMQEVGDYWREPGHDFLVAKQFDITLTDFNQIDRIVSMLDTRGIRSMHIGELKNKDIRLSRRQGKIAALEAARFKAAYLVESMGKKLGDVLQIIEEPEGGFSPWGGAAQSNVATSQAESFDAFRTIQLRYSMRVRFAIAD